MEKTKTLGDELRALLAVIDNTCVVGVTCAEMRTRLDLIRSKVPDLQEVGLYEERYAIAMGALEKYGPALELIADERKRQVNEEGWSSEHDDSHRFGDLAVHAAELAVEGTDAKIKDELRTFDEWGLVAKHKNDRVRCLVIAGALLVAELERESRLVEQEEKR